MECFKGIGGSQIGDDQVMGNKTITAIVIDDDLDTVELFCEYLEIKGIHIIGRGYDGKEAVELYQKLKPDVVFLDIMMPHYDGFYAAEEIRKADPNSKIIMVTADLTSDTAHRLEKLRILTVYKPYEFDDILATVSKLTESSFDHNVLM